MITLYKRHSSGQIGTWSIWQEGYTIYMETRLTPQSEGTTRIEYVETGRGGRNRQEQVSLRIEARARAKLDSGYKMTEDEARQDTTPTSQLELPLPMLAQREVKYLTGAKRIWVQPKLDGMRMVAVRQGPRVVAYSRKGKLIETIPHILEDLLDIMPDGAYWDGELYAHDIPLQTIMSWAKRAQPDTLRLKFHVFDVISDQQFSDRFVGVPHTDPTTSIVKVYTQLLGADDRANLPVMLEQTRRRGYEGLILRADGHGYEAGKRSRNIIKVKQFFDNEFMVVDHTTGAQGEPVLVCRTPAGNTFRVTAPGTHQDRRNAPNLVGKMVTVKYAGLTPYGIPFHPVCLGLRQD